jgi:hypothetical protein
MSKAEVPEAPPRYLPSTFVIRCSTFEIRDPNQGCPVDLSDLFSRAGLGERIPTLGQYVAQMRELNPLVAVLVLGAGLVILLQGWRIFRVWVMVTAAMLGVAAGDRVAQLLSSPHWPVICPLAGGLLLAILAWPLMKYALCLIGAATGGLLGMCLMQYLAAALGRPPLAQYDWAGGIAGAVLLGASAFFLFRMVVILSSSLQGSVMVVSGVVALLLKSRAIRTQLSYALEHSPHVLPLLVAVPAFIGAVFQFLWTSPHRPARQE